MTSAAAVPAGAVPAPAPSDRVRQVVVLVGALVAAGTAAFGAGAFGGTAVQDASGGALSAEATPVAPDNPAFRIWSVIYLGLFAFAVYQVLPRHAASPRLRATAWWVLASMVLNAAWIGVVQAGWVPVSVVVIAALLAVNAVAVVRLVRLRPESTAQAVVLDGTLGLYTGWVSVATLANVAAALADGGVGELGLGATGWSVVLVAAAAVLSVAWARFTAGRRALALGIGLAMSWGLAWIAVARFQGPLVDTTVAWAAVAASAVALVAGVVAATRRPTD
ncbi:tryptophan-rich sensory protein [Cellulosimicrobium sp. BIT-GX5]|uniref:Tryptophan-rich sensory protein n=1 Tax=Cellulosimicrobium composti TaxID=2672572 RepID=A0A6N7ZGK8_9MICO|nr:tryptophan-rich sensory protein [Cellulosimicrobium composti]MTG88390.1 tryptophan-rich sensory protein [Cellulosimicrobium composti]SME98044.1 TspO and MBR related proteins [Cellulosimicrobium cellulans J1]